MALPESVLDALRRRRLLPADGLLVVGVSGGADSLALLHVLVGLRDTLALRLHVVTVEHGVRGAVSIEDMQFVERTCAAWDVPVTARSVRAKLAATSNAGLEAALRALRYTVIAGVAREVGASTVAVAHHADDQAETVLMHLLRGSGLRGLRGIAWRAPLPGHPDLTLVRPLLGVTRAEVEAYCREQGLQPRDDATNRDTTYLRNRLRYEILPLLAGINPRISRTLAQLADLTGVEDDYMEARLQDVIARASVDERRVTLSRSAFVALHPAMQRRFVAWAAGRVGAADDVGYARVLAAVDLALRGEQGARALLPGFAQLRVDYEAIVVEARDATLATDLPLLPPGAVIALTVPGVTPIGGGWALAVAPEPPSAEMDGVGRIAWGGDALTLRARRRADYFAPPGLAGHTQRVSRWMTNRKLPAGLRGRVPLLVAGENIAAIAFGDRWTVAEPFLDRGDSAVLFVRWLRETP